jgi:hypothetical protein
MGTFMINAHGPVYEPTIHYFQKNLSEAYDTKFSGGGERTRTADLLLIRQSLSPLSYTPARSALESLACEGICRGPPGGARTVYRAS